jgi:hypothetical protein
MPVVGLVEATAGVLVPNRLPATMTGTTNADAARPENFVMVIISV